MRPRQAIRYNFSVSFKLVHIIKTMVFKKSNLLMQLTTKAV